MKLPRKIEGMWQWESAMFSEEPDRPPSNTEKFGEILFATAILFGCPSHCVLSNPSNEGSTMLLH